MNLVQQAEIDLVDTLEGDWSAPVILIAPDGTTYDKSANDNTLPLVGQVVYDSIIEDPNTGCQVVVHKPIVTLRKSSLSRVPLPTERWVVKIPDSPLAAASIKSYTISRPTEDGSTIGFVQLHLQILEQSS
jgi:hypothetical protein